MPLEKLNQFSKTHSMLADKPNAVMTAAEVKTWFDAAPEEVREYLNKLIDVLQSTTDGDSGADNIKATPIGTSPDTTQGILEWLKAQIDYTVLGQIPDGSITPVKLNDDAKKAENINLTSANFVSSNVKAGMEELFTNVSDGKQLVGTAITDVDPNVSVPTEPTFLDLATAIGSISAGKKWASGTVTSGASGILFEQGNNGTPTLYPLTVTGLTFKPSMIIAISKDTGRGYFSIYNKGGISNTPTVNFGTGALNDNGSNTSTSTHAIKEKGNAYVNENGFQLPSQIGSRTFVWNAYE